MGEIGTDAGFLFPTLTHRSWGRGGRALGLLFLERSPNPRPGFVAIWNKCTYDTHRISYGKIFRIVIHRLPMTKSVRWPAVVREEVNSSNKLVPTSLRWKETKTVACGEGDILCQSESQFRVGSGVDRKKGPY